MTVLSMVPNDTAFLPSKVTEVAKETLRNFPHSKKVGQYLLGNTLGEGSFAKVKEALHIPTGERVAVKIIDKKKSREDSYVRKNLRREGKILQMIRHSNIVQLLEIMETQNSYYLVTELCRGGDLMDYISQRRRLPEQEVKRYIRQIVSAVDYLHRLGILHRDLKIENLLLDEFRDIKIIDFGLSNCIKVVMTKDGPKAQEYCVTQCGSPAYAAPELLGRRKYGPQVDVWSIGVNMYAMLTGNLPFTVEPFNIKALHNKMINSQMNPLPDCVTRECRDLVKKFLSPDPERRIRLDDVMKHPWIASGVSNPLARAPCPNRIKTEMLDNSILKHMSENQGFRLGEIIRFVTGNVPSSATATYHFFQRKLQKYIGNLKASGKIPADIRLLNRSQQVSVMQMNNTRQTVRITKTANTPSEKDTTTTTKSNVPTTTVPLTKTNGQPQNTEAAKVGEEEFMDILAVKNRTDATQITRTTSPTRIQKAGQTSPTGSPYLPNVARKYMYSQHRNNLYSAIDRSEKKPSQNQEIAETLKEVPDNIETRSLDDEPFRKRASTFPGKIQRPAVHINKLIKQRTDDDKSCGDNNTDTESDNSAAKSNTNKQLHLTQVIVNGNTKKETGSIQREDVTRSPQTGRKGQSPHYVSNVRHTFQRRIIGINHSQNHNQSNQRQDIVQISDARDCTIKDKRLYGQRQETVQSDTEGRSSPARQYLARPIRSNKFVRTKLDTKEEYTVDEQVSEISSGSTRPPSSRNTSGSMNSTTGQTPLPSISPNSLPSKRNP